MRQLKITKSITTREGYGVEQYLNSISESKYPLLSIEQEVELAVRIKNGDRQAITLLTQANLRFVVSVAKQYQQSNSFLTLLDLIQAGNAGIVKAAERFDHTKGFKFISYAVWWIREAISREIQNNNSLVRIPLNQVTNTSKQKRKLNAFEMKEGRKPSETEMEELEIKPFVNLYISSINAPNTGPQGNEETEVWESMQADTPETDDFANAEYNKFYLTCLLNKLSPKHRTIMCYYYGVCGYKQMNVSDIADMYQSTIDSMEQLVRDIRKKLLLYARNSN